jgi:hypothetical protein
MDRPAAQLIRIGVARLPSWRQKRTKSAGIIDNPAFAPMLRCISNDGRYTKQFRPIRG